MGSAGLTRPPEALPSLRGRVFASFCILILASCACHHVRPNRIAGGAEHVLALAKAIETELLEDGASERNFQELLPAYARALKPVLRQGWEQDCDDKCLGTLFEAMDYVCFFSYGQVSNPELPDVMKAIFSALKPSGLASERKAKKARKCLVKFRRFDEAREFAKAEGLDGDKIPSIEIPASLPPARRVMEYAPGGRAISVVQAKPLGKAAVLMLGSPTCGASMEAMKDIQADAGLRKALLGRLTIISSPSGTIEAAAFADWNRRYPRFPQTQAFGAQDWPEVSDWENFPAFHFIANGKVVGYRLGWGPGALDGIKSELRNLDASVAK